MRQTERMPIGEYARKLCKAKKFYDFPAVTYDFDAGKECRHSDMRGVEEYIRDLLTSGERCAVMDGLSNVLYWEWAQDDRQCYRVSKFRSNISPCHLDKFVAIVSELDDPGLVSLKDIGMPQFSGMSFVSKIRMFLDPNSYSILDMTLAEVFSQCDTFLPLKHLTFRKKVDYGKCADVQIRITKNNDQVYGEWASWCRKIARMVNTKPIAPCKNLRAADVERAIFHLAGRGRKSEAWRLLSGPQV